MKVDARPFITGQTYNKVSQRAVRKRKLITRFRYCSIFSLFGIIALVEYHISSMMFYFLFHQPVLFTIIFE